MSDHYSLDVDPEGLRATAKNLGRLHEHLTSKGTKVSATPGHIGDQWQGDAATKIKAEMSGLGSQMSAFADKFATSADALTSLAKDYEHAEDEVARLNTRWATLDHTYDNAVQRAKAQYDDTMRDAGKDPKTGEVNGQVRKMVQYEAGQTQSYATGDAWTAREKGRGELDHEFGLLKQWLAGQTRTAAGALAEAGPSPVTDQQIDDWRNGQYPTRLSHPGLLDAMGQSAERERQEIEAEQKAAWDAAVAEAGGDLKDLEDLLDDSGASPEDIRAALDQIGDRSKDPLYAKALVHSLGDDPSDAADRLNEIYDDLAEHMPTYGEVEQIWPGLQKFNDAIAHGLTQYDDGPVADFAHQFLAQDQGPKRWALLTSSTYADGRMNALALAYSNRMFQADTSSSISGFDPFTSMFNLAFGDRDILDTFADHSSGSDLARMIAAAPSDDARRDLLQELTNVIRDDGYEMDQDDWKLKADLFGDALATLIAGGKQNSTAVEQMLQEINRPMFPYSEDLLSGVQQALDDPVGMSWIIQEIRYGEFSADTLTEAFKSVDIDIDKLVARTITYEVAQGYDQNRLATDVGFLLGTDDLLGESISPEGVIKSLAGSVAGLNPVSGAAYGVFQALFDEMEEIEQKEEDWDEGWGNEKAQRLLSFTIYAQAHGGEVPGFDAWVTQHHREHDSEAIIDFYQELEDSGAAPFDELDELRTDIDEARDES